jgi:myosin-7
VQTLPSPTHVFPLITDSIFATETGTSIIGVLDIFGFEHFQKNSFEQLCINFANEKLQQKFNQSIFKEELALYKAEKIDTEDVSFEDNQNVLDLIEQRSRGIFPILDEELRLPKSTDQTFLTKLVQAHDKKAGVPFEKPIKVPNSFSVRHYAGDVTYDVEGFLDKNKDQMFDDLIRVIVESDSNFIANLMLSSSPSTGGDTVNTMGRSGSSINRGAKRTLASQFTVQLNNLMDTIHSTTPHYIRCIKPNTEKQPAAELFDSPMANRQLKYAGVFEAVSIRRRGYAFRMAFDEFWKKFSVLASVDTRKSSWPESIEALFQAVGPTLPPLQKGLTMIFYRAETRKGLENMRNQALRAKIIKIQKVFRGHRARKIYKEARVLSQRLAAAVAARSLEQLSEVLNELSSFKIAIKYVSNFMSCQR